MPVQKFENLPVSEELTDADMVSQIIEMPEEGDSNKDDTPVAVSSKEAIMAAWSLQQYMMQNERASESHCSMVNQVLSFLEQEQIPKKQTKLTDYFKK